MEHDTFGDTVGNSTKAAEHTSLLVYVIFPSPALSKSYLVIRYVERSVNICTTETSRYVSTNLHTFVIGMSRLKSSLVQTGLEKIHYAIIIREYHDDDDRKEEP